MGDDNNIRYLPRGEHQEALPQRVRPSVSIFQVDDDGRVDLTPGVHVTDAVVALWEALEPVVRQSWEETALARERARTRVLTAYLDKVRPKWRIELEGLV